MRSWRAASGVSEDGMGCAALISAAASDMYRQKTQCKMGKLAGPRREEADAPTLLPEPPRLTLKTLNEAA